MAQSGATSSPARVMVTAACLGSAVRRGLAVGESGHSRLIAGLTALGPGLAILCSVPKFTKKKN